MALALGYIPLDGEPIPLALRIFIGAIGAILLLAAYSVMRFRMKRRAAYAGGRETRGTARLRHLPGEDDSGAQVMFANNHTEWMMSIERGSLKGLEDRLQEGVKATAYLGEDDRIYGLDIEGRRTKLSGPRLRVRREAERTDRARRTALPGRRREAQRIATFQSGKFSLAESESDAYPFPYWKVKDTDHGL